MTAYKTGRFLDRVSQPIFTTSPRHECPFPISPPSVDIKLVRPTKYRVVGRVAKGQTTLDAVP